MSRILRTGTGIVLIMMSAGTTAGISVEVTALGSVELVESALVTVLLVVVISRVTISIAHAFTHLPFQGAISDKMIRFIAEETTFAGIIVVVQHVDQLSCG